MGCSKSSPERGIYSNKHLYVEKTKITNKQPNFTHRKLEKEQLKPKVSKRKEITEIRPEIKEIENENTKEKINETKSWFLETNKIDKPFS